MTDEGRKEEVSAPFNILPQLGDVSVVALPVTRSQTARDPGRISLPEKARLLPLKWLAPEQAARPKRREFTSKWQAELL